MQFRKSTVTTTNAQSGSKDSGIFNSSNLEPAFGSDKVAITHVIYSNGVTKKCDVVVNTVFPFDSYRGNLRAASNGGTLYDLRRVLLY